MSGEQTPPSEDTSGTHRYLSPDSSSSLLRPLTFLLNSTWDFPLSEINLTTPLTGPEDGDEVLVLRVQTHIGKESKVFLGRT